eukprot:1362518-Amorphochlora_amoeboformis.AAC.1
MVAPGRPEDSLCIATRHDLKSHDLAGHVLTGPAMSANGTREARERTFASSILSIDDSDTPVRVDLIWSGFSEGVK